MEEECTDEQLEEIHTMAKDPNIYTELARSIAPNIYGNDDIKKSILLMLVGGLHKVTKKEVILLIRPPGVSLGDSFERGHQHLDRGRCLLWKESIPEVRGCICAESCLRVWQVLQCCWIDSLCHQGHSPEVLSSSQMNRIARVGSSVFKLEH